MALDYCRSCRKGNLFPLFSENTMEVGGFSQDGTTLELLVIIRDSHTLKHDIVLFSEPLFPQRQGKFLKLCTISLVEGICFSHLIVMAVMFLFYFPLPPIYF